MDKNIKYEINKLITMTCATFRLAALIDLEAHLRSAFCDSSFIFKGHKKNKNKKVNLAKLYIVAFFYLVFNII